MWLHKWLEKLLTTLCWKKEVLKQWRIQGKAGTTQQASPPALMFRPNWPNWDQPPTPNPTYLRVGMSEPTPPTPYLKFWIRHCYVLWAVQVHWPQISARSNCRITSAKETHSLYFSFAFCPNSSHSTRYCSRFFLPVQKHCELIVQEYKPYTSM